MDAVQSIINQTYQNWELLILSDDPDSTNIEYHSLDKRIEVVECNERRGKWYRINKGLTFSSGSYIAFQDADDISISQRLELSLHYIGGADFLYGDSISMFQNGTNCYNKCQELDIANRPLGNQGSYFFKKNDVSYPEIGRGDDWLFVAKCLKAGMKFKYLPLPLFFYREYTGNFRKSSNRLKRFLSNRRLKKLVTEITKP